MGDSRLGSVNISEGHGVSPTSTLHGNQPPDISRLAALEDTPTPVNPSDKQGTEDASTLVVDWDGPNDPENPKK